MINVVCLTARGTRADGVQEQSAEEIFGSTEREEVTGEWRKLHNEEFYSMYCHKISFGW